MREIEGVKRVGVTGDNDIGITDIMLSEHANSCIYVIEYSL